MNTAEDKDAAGLLTQVRAVTFDVGGTLIKPSPSVGDIYAEVAARHGRKKVSPETLNRRFAAARAPVSSFIRRIPGRFLRLPRAICGI